MKPDGIPILLRGKDIHDVQNMSALDYLDNPARTWPATRTEEHQKLRLVLK
jgi:hypothetical protein